MRPAVLSDRLVICTLLQQAWHSAGGCRWDQLDALEAGCHALLACRGNQVVGFGLFDLRVAPVARLSAVAFADGQQVGSVWDEFWHAAEASLRERGIERAYYVGEAPWLLEVLAAAGFRQVNELVSYERLQGGVGTGGNVAVRLRPARASDLDAVAAIDRASLPPLWHCPRPMLEALLQLSTRFTVAEVERRLVGYEVSHQESGEGQVVRLAVLPEVRRQGIATRMIAEALDVFRRSRVRRVVLNTQQDNVPAQAFYERCGFQRTGEVFPVLEKVLEHY